MLNNVYEMKIDNYDKFIIRYDTTTKQYDVVRYDYNAIACYDVYDSLFNKVPVFNNLMACIEYMQNNFNNLY